MPVLSWLLLRGRCRTCGARISILYPLTELATAGLFAGAALQFDRTLVAATMAGFFAMLLAASAIDARHRIIPNRLVLPSAAILAAMVIAADATGGGVSAGDAALGLLAYSGGLLLISLISPRGMGMGDVKLAAVIGFVLGSLGLRYVAVAAGAAVLGGGVAAIGALLAGRSRKDALPFGPFLAAGAVLAAFLGPQIAHLYLRLIT